MTRPENDKLERMQKEAVMAQFHQMLSWHLPKRLKKNAKKLNSEQPVFESRVNALSPGVKRPKREAEHSLPASAKVKKIWIYTVCPGSVRTNSF
jgi:hypothetical protein